MANEHKNQPSGRLGSSESREGMRDRRRLNWAKIGGIVGGAIGIFLLVILEDIVFLVIIEGWQYGVVVSVLLLFPVWRIFKRAGINKLLSITILIPYIGIFIVGLLLTLSTWKLNPGGYEHR